MGPDTTGPLALLPWPETPRVLHRASQSSRTLGRATVPLGYLIGITGVARPPGSSEKHQSGCPLRPCTALQVTTGGSALSLLLDPERQLVSCFQGCSVAPRPSVCPMLWSGFNPQGVHSLVIRHDSWRVRKEVEHVLLVTNEA